MNRKTEVEVGKGRRWNSAGKKLTPTLVERLPERTGAGQSRKAGRTGGHYHFWRHVIIK